DGVFFVHTSLKSLADTKVSSMFFALSGAKNLLGQKRNLIMSKHLPNPKEIARHGQSQPGNFGFRVLDIPPTGIRC
ncbi:MAG: hypothetical protein KI786_01545, partial [Mameliella sp.]|nr:hypothetical protein [Phaeodactylibacter sp.]